MSELDIVELGATRVDGGNALWQGVTKVSEDEGDNEPMGEGPVFQGLGLSSCAWPSDDAGKAEAVCVRSVAGRDTVYVGARDTRSAAIVGNLKPGDTVVHSTGPQQAAQLQLKEGKRQAALVSKNAAGNTMVFLLDGDADKAQIVLAGMVFEMNASDKSFTMSNGKASILIQGDTIALDGNVILGGTKPNPALKFMIAPGLAPAPVPIATTAAGHPVAAAKGVFAALLILLTLTGSNDVQLRPPNSDNSNSWPIASADSETTESQHWDRSTWSGDSKSEHQDSWFGSASYSEAAHDLGWYRSPGP